MSDTPRRRERGQRDGQEPALGHGPGSDRPSLPRPLQPPAGGDADGDAAPRARSSLPASADGLAALPPDFWTIVEDGLAALAVTLTPGARAAIDAHARLLLAWNSAINLTALRSPRQVAIGHVLDSLAALPVVDRLRPDADSLLDIGSGGGYPGLPLSVALPVGRAALVDSVGKKARFLGVAATAARAAVTAAGEPAPALEALAERAEDLADEPDQRERWQLVTARAVGSLAEVAELALPLLSVGGHVIAWKRDAGDRSLRAELAAARPLLRLAGAARAEVEPVPEARRLGLEGHVLVTIRKARPTPLRFPRPPAERRRALLT